MNKYYDEFQSVGSSKQATECCSGLPAGVGLAGACNAVWLLPYNAKQMWIRNGVTIR